jgi:hypothetical protein
MNNTIISIATKICTKCKNEKSISNFYNEKSCKDGLSRICKSCRDKISKKHRLKNLKKIKQERKLYWIKNKKQITEIHLQWRSRNKEYDKKYRLINIDKLNQYKRKYKKDRLKNDINFKILHYCSTRIRAAIRGNQKSSNTEKLLGCTIPELKSHLEKHFRIGMTWKNYGFGNKKWHIDHIIPCAFFNMSDPVEQYMCFNYTNLQPLWQPDNLEKSDKITLVQYVS